MQVLNAKIVRGKQCGMEVYRLLVFRNGVLTLLKTHMSEAAARYQWEAIKCRVGIAAL